MSVQLVNIAAEARKKGMSGSFSLQLLSRMHSLSAAGARQLVVCCSKADIADCAAQLEAIFGAAAKEMTLATPASAKALPPATYDLVAILLADTLLAKEDFRCDERAVQALTQLRERCAPGGLLFIQTREEAHPVFDNFTRDCSGEMLSERRQFAYPPFTRLVHIVLKDNNIKRLNYLSRELLQALRGAVPLAQWTGPYGDPDRIIRAALPRDKNLKPSKRALARTVQEFGRDRKYDSHMVIDVDPV